MPTLLVILVFYKLGINNIFLWFKKSWLELGNTRVEISKNEQTSLAETWENKLILELKNKVVLQRLSKIDNNTLQVETNEGIIILFNPQDNLKVQINSLQTILTKSRIEKRPLKRIDLRFNKVALEYQ